jgi:hypothetical protein
MQLIVQARFYCQGPSPRLKLTEVFAFLEQRSAHQCQSRGLGEESFFYSEKYRQASESTSYPILFPYPLLESRETGAINMSYGRIRMEV